MVKKTGTRYADEFFGNGSDQLIFCGGGDDLYSERGSRKSNDVVHGGSGDDLLYSIRGSDRFFGDGGNDRFILSGDSDVYVSGGSGKDYVRILADQADAEITKPARHHVHIEINHHEIDIYNVEKIEWAT